MKNKERAWENFGDVNFLEYGGCLTRKGQEGIRPAEPRDIHHRR